jgi:hypothetical protein
MKITAGEAFVVIIPDPHREVTWLARDGVTDVLMEVAMRYGIVGRGEGTQRHRQLGQPRLYPAGVFAREEG